MLDLIKLDCEGDYLKEKKNTNGKVEVRKEGDPGKDNPYLDMALEDVIKKSRKEMIKAKKEKRKEVLKEKRKVNSKAKVGTQDVGKLNKFNMVNGAHSVNKAAEIPKGGFKTKDLRANAPVPKDGFRTKDLRAKMKSENGKRFNKNIPKTIKQANGTTFKRFKQPTEPVSFTKRVELKPKVKEVKPAPEISIKGLSAPTTVMVSNIHHLAKADDIKLCFGQVGKVLAVNYLYNSYREFTGHAEIEMGSLVEANQIVKHFDGRLADGQVLHVVIKPPTQKSANKEVSSEHTPPSRNRQSTSHRIMEDRREEPSFRSSNGLRNGYNRAFFNSYSRPSYTR